MMLAFLLVVIVDGSPLPNSSNWLFASILTCNRAAHYIESGKQHPKDRNRGNANVTAYCIPQSVGSGTKLWY